MSNGIIFCSLLDGIIIYNTNRNIIDIIIDVIVIIKGIFSIHIILLVAEF